MPENVIIKQVTPEAIFLVDARQFEMGLCKYDERLANSLMSYQRYEEADQPLPNPDRPTP